jgi:hypothetical protein
MKMVTIVLCSLMMLLGNAAFANDKALQNALAKAQYMLRQNTAEKQQLQQKLDALEKEFKEYKDQAGSKLAAKESTSKKLGRTLALDESTSAELQGNYVELLELFRQEQAVANDLDQKLTDKVAQFDQCRDHNLNLFEVNKEILGQYKDKGFWDVVASNEPFTGIKQVEIENIIQEYQFKNEDLLIEDPVASHAN